MSSVITAIFLICLTLVGGSDAESASQQYVTKACNQRLKNIDSIAKFKEFMHHYRVYTSNNHKPKKGGLNLDRNLRDCFGLKDAVFDLEQIIDSRKDGVCRMSYINKLIEFKVKHILNIDGDDKDYKNFDKIESKSSYIAFFFTIYAYQVAYQCKSQLPKRLNNVQKNQECSRVLVEMIPDLSGHDEIRDQDDEIKIASTLLSESRVESFIPILHLKHLHLPVANIDVVIPNSAMTRIEALQEECRKIEPFYTAGLAPVGALAQFGYEIDQKLITNDDYFDPKFEENLKCWLATAQLCQGILRTHLKVSEKMDFDLKLDSKFISVELKGSPSDLPIQNDYQDGPAHAESDSFEEVSPIALKLAKKRLTFKSRVMYRVSNAIRQFIERRIDIKASQEGSLRSLLDFIKSMDNDIDKKVSFGGRAVPDATFNPTAVVTDNADAIIRTASPFFNKEIGFFMSCIVGVAMSAVFVYLSVYMLASVVKHRDFTSEGHSKSDWKKLRDEKVAKINANLTGKNRSFLGMHVYKPQK